MPGSANGSASSADQKVQPEESVSNDSTHSSRPTQTITNPTTTVSPKPQSPSPPAPTPQLSTNPLIAYFEGRGTDMGGKYLREVLDADDRALERSHNYIQTLFPLPEDSAFAKSMLVTEEVFLAFRTRPELREKLREALHRMCEFWGFEMRIDGNGRVEIRRGAAWSHKSRNWAGITIRSDHNHLRMTRVIRSLRVLGLEPEARALFEALRVVYEEGLVGETSFMFWERAANRRLDLEPGMSEERARDYIGKTWLRELDVDEGGDGGGGRMRGESL